MQFSFQTLLYFSECHHKILPIRATQKYIIHVHCLVAQQSDLDQAVSPSLKAIPYRQLHHRNTFDIYILTIRLHLCKFLNTPSESQDLSVLLLSPLRTHCVTKSGCPVLVRQFCTRAGCFSACRISFRCCPAKYGIPRIIIQSDEPRCSSCRYRANCSDWQSATRHSTCSSGCRATGTPRIP